MTSWSGSEGTFSHTLPLQEVHVTFKKKNKIACRVSVKHCFIYKSMNFIYPMFSFLN